MLAGILTDYAFGLGYMLVAGVAYLIRDWRKLQLAISAPGFLLIFYIWWETQLAPAQLDMFIFVGHEYTGTLFAIRPSLSLSLASCQGGASVCQMVVGQRQERGSHRTPPQGSAC